MKLLKNAVICSLLFVFLISCGKISKTLSGAISSMGSKEAWSEVDRPDAFDENLVYTLKDLPLEGEAEQIPWAGSYWPTYMDTINYRWDGDESLAPSEKYAKAFEVSRVVEDVSLYSGIDSQYYAAPCTVDTQDLDCNNDLGEVCAVKRGETEGKCVQTWFGQCHAWAPAAIMVKEPKRAVTHNGVEFKVNDIKALATFAFNRGLEVKFLSGRCNNNDEAGDIEYDESGRPVSSRCRDTNPGTFHIITTNYLGIKKESFVEDRTFDYQVWNQPVRSYKIFQQTEIDAKSANLLIGVKEPKDEYMFNDKAAKLYLVAMEFNYITESDIYEDGNLQATIDNYTKSDFYTYILEVDAEGRVIGGEWVGESKKNHPDFLWLPYQKIDASYAGVSWKDVEILVKKSTEGPLDPEPQPEPEPEPELIVYNNETWGFSFKYSTKFLEARRSSSSSVLIGHKENTGKILAYGKNLDNTTTLDMLIEKEERECKNSAILGNNRVCEIEQINRSPEGDAFIIYGSRLNGKRMFLQKTYLKDMDGKKVEKTMRLSFPRDNILSWATMSRELLKSFQSN